MAKHSKPHDAPAGSEEDQPPSPLPPLVASTIPLVQANPVSDYGADACPYIPDDKFVDGIWTRKSDGEQYALCIHPPTGYGNTHMCRNTVHQWEGVEAQFNAEFTRK